MASRGLMLWNLKTIVLVVGLYNNFLYRDSWICLSIVKKYNLPQTLAVIMINKSCYSLGLDCYNDVDNDP